MVARVDSAGIDGGATALSTGGGVDLSAGDRSLRVRLARLLAHDAQTRAELAAEGELFDGYHPVMEAVHRSNARALETILDQGGWPGRGQAGVEGAEAAFRIAQHAISLPDFQRRCLALLQEAVARGEAPAWQAAMLEDRIRFNERRPQRFGTVFDWDQTGVLSPWALEDPDGVERLRAAAGLGPLAAAAADLRRQAAAEGDRPPADPRARQREIEAWARRVGWIS